MSKEQLVTDIVGFLQQSITKGEVSGDEKESIELAIDCIRETFKVPENSEPNDLLAIYKKGSDSAPAASASPASTAAKSGSAPTETQAVYSDEVKAEADALKAQGNKQMAARKFQDAVDLYTQAIEKYPLNALYWSNRAAAFTHLNLNNRSVEDARKAIEIDPSYAKAWSRLGLALWAEGDYKGSLDAYEFGLKAEGDSPTEAMKRDYENVRKRYAEQQAKARASGSDVGEAAPRSAESSAAESGNAQASGGPGGFDMSQLSSFMNNPQIQQMASSLMSNPDALQNIMNSPMAKSMQERLRSGNMPSMSELGNMMNDGDVQDMMKNFK